MTARLTVELFGVQRRNCIARYSGMADSVMEVTRSFLEFQHQPISISLPGAIKLGWTLNSYIRHLMVLEDDDGLANAALFFITRVAMLLIGSGTRVLSCVTGLRDCKHLEWLTGMVGSYLRNTALHYRIFLWNFLVLLGK